MNVLVRLWRWMRRGHATRRAARERARFWAELQEGQREAEARLRPRVG
jgi:hypothetical protein